MREEIERDYSSSGFISVLIFGSDVGHYVLIEELENQRDAVGKDEMLRHEFKLIDVIQFQVLQ